MNLIQKLQPQIEKIKTINHRLGFEISCDLEVANLCAIGGCHGNWLGPVITKLKEDTFATELTAREDYKFLFSEETF